MKNKRPQERFSDAKFFLKQACMFDAVIEYALCGLRPRAESK
jgi:hypothetical protein